MASASTATRGPRVVKTLDSGDRVMLKNGDRTTGSVIFVEGTEAMVQMRGLRVKVSLNKLVAL